MRDDQGGVIEGTADADGGLIHSDEPSETPPSERRDRNARTAPVVQRKSDWLSPGVVVGLMRATDVVVVLLAGALAYLTRFQTFAERDDYGVELYGMVLGVVLTANIFQFVGLYGFRNLTGLFAQAGRLLLAWSAVIMTLLALAFATKTAHEASRLWVGLWFLYGFAGLLALRLLVKRQLLRLQEAGRLTRNVVVVGAGEHGRRLIEHLREGEAGVRLIGVFDDRASRVPAEIGGHPKLGTVDDLLAFARSRPIDQVILALPWNAESRLLCWMKKLKSLPVDVRLCPDMIGFHLPYRGVSHLDGVPLLNVFERPLSGWDSIVKAVEDRCLAALILLLVAPLMLLIALLIKLDSPGPALYRQKRYGFNNEVIEVLKFRTMYLGACDRDDETEVCQATRHDPRVTRIGRLLRRTSLDELPQLLNVLSGTMSVVGPRPHAVAHNEQYARVIDEYLGRHRVRPGITGWAQVNGLRGETDTLAKMEQRVRYDLYYIENWSLTFDLRIILLTLLFGFRNQNAY